MYSICYSIDHVGQVYQANQVDLKYENDDEAKKELPDGLFLQLDLTQKQLVLNFDFEILDKKCFFVNQTLMNYDYFLIFLILHLQTVIKRALSEMLLAV